MTRPTFTLLLAKILLALCIIGLAVLPVFAHSWYDPACCSKQDCAPVPTAAVTAVPGGWLVRLEPGDHFLVKTPMEKLIPYADALVSQDGSFHVCVVISYVSGIPEPTVRCLYVPPMGT